jgi:hypothetical protein
VLGPLSLRERARVRALKRPQDLQQHLLGLQQHMVIGKAKDENPRAGQEGATTLIVGATDRCQVLAAVRFNGKPACTAEEVQYGAPPRVLTTKLETA